MILILIPVVFTIVALRRQSIAYWKEWRSHV
jgi:hypothetical protein